MLKSTTLIPFKSFKKELGVMVVEDDASIIEQLNIFLSHHFDHIHTCPNGQEGLKLYQEQKIDIIVTDVNMPRMGGMEMVQKIREMDSDQASVIFLTAFSDSDFLIEAMHLRADDYIVKPIDPSLLLQALEKSALLQYSRIAREHQVRMEMMEASHEAKSALIREVAHHWRNPLNIISMQLQLVEEMLSDSPELEGVSREFLASLDEKIQTSIHTAQNMSGIINDFSSMVNARKGDIVTLERLIEKCHHICLPLCKAENVVLKMDIEPDAGRVDVNARLQIAMYQLIKNSLESIKLAGGEAGEIRIRVWVEDEKLHIRCTDNGAGIAPGVFQSVCEPYVSTKQESHGHGLGLFLVSEIIQEGCEGTLAWENGEDGGASFIITIPIIGDMSCMEPQILSDLEAPLS